MSPAAEIITIGNELLRGNTLNTNAQFLGKELTRLGFSVRAQSACPDSPPAIQDALDRALCQADLVILSGGLGPTPDDVTREAIAEYFKRPLVFSKSQYHSIQQYYRRHGHAIPSQVRKEAYYPQKATPLVNRFGIALGFYLLSGKQLLIVLPGVPAELENMFRDQVVPLLKRYFRRLAPKPLLVAKLTGISEPSIMTKLGHDFFDNSFDFGIYPEAGQVTIRIYAERPTLLRCLRSKMKERLGEFIYAWDEITLTEITGRILARKKKTLSVAESCTGGLLASELTKIAGASRYFKGGMIAYSNQVKEELGISKSVLAAEGAVSKKVAAALAQNIRHLLKTDYGVGITGIAGPTGGTPAKPVGLVFISLADRTQVKVCRHLFWGDRRQVQIKAVRKALEYLWRKIR